MPYDKQYRGLKKIARKMLLDAGVAVDLEFDSRVSHMAASILDDLYGREFTDRQISDAIKVLRVLAL